LESVGAAKQQQEQQALNLAKQQFIQEQTFPEANLQQYSSIIHGYNLPPNTYQSAQTVTPAPSYMQQIAGLGMAGAGIAGAFGNFGGKKEGGLVGLARGGKVLRRGEGGATQEGSDLSTKTDDELRKMLVQSELPIPAVQEELAKRPSATQIKSPTLIGRINSTVRNSSGLGRDVSKIGDAVGSGLSGAYDYLVKKPVKYVTGYPEDVPVPEKQAPVEATPTPVAPAPTAPPKEKDGTPAITSNYESPSSDALSQKSLLAKTNRNVVDTSAWDDLIKSPGKTGDDTRKAMNDLRGELAVKLDETSEKQKGILNKRQDELGKQKWMALAEMGASVLAQPGGQTFLQAMGKGVKESGIIGTLAKIGDKSSDLDKDLAEMDVKTMMSKYGLKREELLDINDQKKQDLEERKARSDAVFNKERIRIQDDKNLTALEHASAMSELQRKRLEETGYHNTQMEQLRRSGDELRSDNNRYRTAATITEKFQKAGADMSPAQLEANLKRYSEGSPEYNGLMLSQRGSGSFILGRGQAGTAKAP